MFSISGEEEAAQMSKVIGPSLAGSSEAGKVKRPLLGSHSQVLSLGAQLFMPLTPEGNPTMYNWVDSKTKQTCPRFQSRRSGIP